MTTSVTYPAEWRAISLQVKIDAGFRCVRCGHPNGVFVPDGRSVDTVLGGTITGVTFSELREYNVEGGRWFRHHEFLCDEQCTHDPEVTDWRILTVHHLDGVKDNLAWWNLMPACQRCHLTIQGKVRMDQGYQLPHSRWFLPYVAGFYAHTHTLGHEPAREEIERDLTRYLTLGQPHLEEHYRAMLT